MTALIQGAGTPLRQPDLPDGAAICRRSVDAWVGNALPGVTGPSARITFLFFSPPSQPSNSQHARTMPRGSGTVRGGRENSVNDLGVEATWLNVELPHHRTNMGELYMGAWMNGRMDA